MNPQPPAVPARPPVGGTGWFAVGRAAYGGAALCAPARIAGLAAGAPPGSAARLAGRLIGARQVVQAAVTVRPSPDMLRLGAAT
ncbi:MAG TPA: hypothetical protein VKU39_03090, partial [Streptosporangiaceae bacterium]|nr:hypothetical protein [Streptosporangiaceae bacterium]